MPPTGMGAGRRRLTVAGRVSGGVAAICLALLSTGAQASTELSCPVPPGGADAVQPPLSEPHDLAEEAARLLAWIGAHSDLPIAPVMADLPAVRFCDVGEIVPYEAGDIEVHDRLKGAYDAVHNVIYLVGPWTGETELDRSVLLHELVHAAQMRGPPFPCTAAMEWDAYRLQEAYLAERGIDPGFNWFAIHMLSRCPDLVHP